MMPKLYSNEEMHKARNVNLAMFLSDYDPYRYNMNRRGYIVDEEKETIVFSLKSGHWFNNTEVAVGKKMKHGNIIDYLMYIEGETFPDAMQIILRWISLAEQSGVSTKNPFLENTEK